jgi:extracellular factor (EF) 3-hydroxypalmitic acid methyl ester biosynthesis protein
MIKDLLNTIYDEIQSGDVQNGMENLINELRDIRNNSDHSRWNSFLQSCLVHPLKGLVHSDPFTLRSYEKPRGYPGDAVLLDMIYFPDRVQIDDIPPIGKQIFEYTINSPACKAVRHRKDLLAKTIDEFAFKNENPKIMSLACGHLREAEVSSVIKNKSFREFLAIDYDQVSLKHIETVLKPYRPDIKPLHLSIHDILKGQAVLGNDFDLIYSAGLYDYLNQKTASKLTAMLFDMLASNGKLLVANFFPGIKDVGYMETYMGWHLVFRDESQMIELAREIPRNKIRKLELFSEKQENIVFFKIHKIVTR